MFPACLRIRLCLKKNPKDNWKSKKNNNLKKSVFCLSCVCVFDYILLGKGVERSMCCCAANDGLRGARVWPGCRHPSVQCAPGPFITGGGPHRARSIRRTGWLSSSCCILSVFPTAFTQRLHKPGHPAEYPSTLHSRVWRITCNDNIVIVFMTLACLLNDCYSAQRSEESVSVLCTSSALHSPERLRCVCTNAVAMVTIQRPTCVLSPCGARVVAVDQIMRKKIQPSLFLTVCVRACVSFQLFKCTHTWLAPLVVSPTKPSIFSHRIFCLINDLVFFFSFPVL